ncbi:hypothetical protein [Erythrobacter litoralis]|nr:hypothetical protein [Erythrobacter litoralis]
MSADAEAMEDAAEAVEDAMDDGGFAEADAGMEEAAADAGEDTAYDALPPDIAVSDDASDQPVVRRVARRAPASIDPSNRRTVRTDRPESDSNGEALASPDPELRRSEAPVTHAPQPSENAGDDAEEPDAGYALLAAKPEMEVDERYPVKLLVGEKERLEDMSAAAQSIGDMTQSGELELAPYICGILTAPGFVVEEEMRQCQDRGRSPEVSFTWHVAPNTDRPLTLQAKAITYDTEGGRPIDQRDSETLQIAVNASGFTKFNIWVREMTESVGGLRILLLAILAMLGVVSAIVWRLKTMGSKPDDGALRPPPES